MFYKHPSHRFALWFATLTLVAFSGLILPAILAPIPGSTKFAPSPAASSSAAPGRLKPVGAVSRLLNPDVSATPQTQSNPDDSLIKSANNYGRLPLSFEVNRGQTDRRVKFLARGQGYGLFLTSTGAVLSLSKVSKVADGGNNVSPYSSSETAQTHAVLSLSLQGANHKPRVRGVDQLPGKANYFAGRDQSKWRIGVPTFARVQYQGVYPGIDLVYYGNQLQLEYDFVVSPGADPRKINLTFSGNETIKVDQQGDLVLSTKAGDVIQRRPIAYQNVNGERSEVAANYRVEGERISFELGAYDKTKALIIDPVLSYSTYLGGVGSDQGRGIKVDAQGNAFLTGSTSSIDFPLAGPMKSYGGNTDAFVVKLNPAGTALIYSTYLGGLGFEVGNAIAIDSQGNAFVTGNTGSGNFPVTPGAFQNSIDRSLDGFVSKLNATGSALIYSTYLGGDNIDFFLDIAAGTDGRAHVVGRTESFRFGLTIPLERHGNAVYKSFDKGINWSASSAQLTATRVNTFAQDPVNWNIIYAGSNFGIFKSVNGGANWNLTGNPNQQVTFFITSIAIDASNTDIIYAATFNQGVFKSTNGGLTYTAKDSGFSSLAINAIAIDPVTPTTLYAGTNNGPYKSTNGGDTWTLIRNGISGIVPRVDEVVLDPANPATIYIGTGRGMFKTTNGGDLWTAINGGALSTSISPQITALVIDPINPAILYAAGANGQLYKTVDSGGTWTLSGFGLPPIIPVTTLAIDPATPSILYAGGASLHKSVDSGATWLQSSAGITNFTITGLAVDRVNPANVFAGTVIGADAFAVRLDPTGSTLEHLLTFGGDEDDQAVGVALDATDTPYVVGVTSSPNFPVSNAFQPTHGGAQDGFLGKLNAAGTGFVYSTFLGGRGVDQVRDVAVRQGSAYVVGITDSTDFPLVTPLKSTLQEFDLDAFVTKFTPSGSALEFSTLFGSQFGFDLGLAIALNANGAIYITGQTSSFAFPVLHATQSQLAGNGSTTDAFLTKLNSTGRAIIYSTYLGGSLADLGESIAVDANGNPYVIGTTSSFNFPIANALQGNLNAATDAFVTKFEADGDLALTKSEVRDPVMVGNSLTYILTVRNLGVAPVTGIALTDTLPASVSFFSATPSQGSCSGTSTVTCNLGDLAQEASATVSIVVTPQSIASISNTATVTSTFPDSIIANNSATQTTTISALPSIAGRIADVTGTGTAGVNVLVTGSLTVSGAATDFDGRYQRSELVVGGNYTVTPSRDGFVFHPQNRSFTNLTADATADFESVACIFQLTPTTQTFLAAGGNGSVTISAPDSLCPWTAVSDVPWITITSSAAGIGSGTVNFSVAPTVNARTGTLQIAGKVFKISQEAPLTVAFTASHYTAGEGAARVLVSVVRPGNSAGAASVGYATSDTAGLTNCNVVNGIASARCDYATSVGRLSFAAGETSKTISIPIVDDAYAEGSESFTISLSSSTGAALVTPSTATVTIIDNETVNGANPIDQTPFFVRQQYVDFLGREPDPGGAAGWEAVINNCPAGDTTCDRIHVSSAFFRSAEFQGRGYFIYRFYPVAFGRKPDFVEFIPDLAKVSGFLSDAQLEAAKVAFIDEFMSRPAFVTKYSGLNDTQYVDTLLATAQITSPHRDFWIAALGNGTRTRATVLRDISESLEVYNKFYNQAFVVMQYFGYLRRDPDALYLDWIQVLDTTGDFRGMINGFMNSLEYRFRFGP
jgi:uncharacterized repeat protein (TIGR01451 family)